MATEQLSDVVPEPELRKSAGLARLCPALAGPKASQADRLITGQAPAGDARALSGLLTV